MLFRQLCEEASSNRPIKLKPSAAKWVARLLREITFHLPADLVTCRMNPLGIWALADQTKPSCALAFWGCSQWCLPVERTRWNTSYLYLPFPSSRKLKRQRRLKRRRRKDMDASTDPSPLTPWQQSIFFYWRFLYHADIFFRLVIVETDNQQPPVPHMFTLLFQLLQLQYVFARFSSLRSVYR